MLEKKFVNINGNNLAYFEKGNSNKILLFSSGFGTPFTLADMYELFENLSKDFRCIALDRFGYGYSDIIVSERSIEDITDEYIEFLKKLEIDSSNVVFVGHSISTFYGISLNSKINLKGLVLIDNENITNFAKYLTKLSYGIYYHLKNTPVKKLFNKSAKRALLENRDLPNEIKEETINILEQRLPNINMWSELTSFLKEIKTFNSKYLRNKLKLALLVCRNETYNHNLKLKDNFENATILNLGKTDHFIHYEHFKEIISSIKDLF